VANTSGYSVIAMLKVVPTFLSAELARRDIGSITKTMFDLQRQTATGYKATDLKGFGEDNRQILSARGEIQRLEARGSAAARAETRLGVQEFALDQAAEGMKQLRDATLRAITQDDGRFVQIDLESAFRLVQSGLNQTYGGQYLFSGERSDEPPVRVGSLKELVDLPTDLDIFTKSPRDAVMDIGDGAPMPVADQAADFANLAMVSIREMARALRSEGGSFSQPLTVDQKSRLSRMVELVDKSFSEFSAAQGRNGALQKRVENERIRLGERVDFLEAEIGKAADANLAEVAMRIAAAQTQYQAAGRVFAQLSELSILNFLR
jgi:flagellar hook-associated protein 3 FlgL